MADKPVTRSCLVCPSYLNLADAAAEFGKSIKAPMCARFGKVLGRSDATVKQNNSTAELIAKDCPNFSDPKPRFPDAKKRPMQLEVMLPDPTARVELGPMDTQRTMVNSCAQCTNFVQDDKVYEATGWAAGLCRAKGRLIPGNRRAAEAQGCTFKRVGRQQEVVDLSMLPVYVNVSAGPKRDADSWIEPLDYPTDADVKPEEEEAGIQAWRRIEDPDGSGNAVMLPIFSPKAFTEEELALIPQTGDDEHPELYRDHAGATYQIAALWMELDETPAAWGMPGVGKTEIGRHLAWMMQVPFHRFSIKESTELYELEGSQQFTNGETHFRDGRFVKAWGSRGVMVVDEPNMGRPEVWAFLRPCMDNSKQLVLDSDGGRLVKRHDFAFLMLAMNPSWSPLNVGTAPIGAADARRLAHIEFGLPDEEVEREIIEARILRDGWIIDQTRLNLVMSISEKIRELVDMGALAFSWGISENIKAARMLRLFDPIKAYRMAGADYLEPQQRDSLLDQVRAADTGAAFPKIQMVEEGDN